MDGEGLVSGRIYGDENKPTVYFMTGYDSTIARHRLPIMSLQTLGYRVVAYEYSPMVLGGGSPGYLVDAVESVVASVNQDKTDHKVAGVYGVSLGSLFAYNVVQQPGIQKAVFNTGGVSMVKALWERPRLLPERIAMEQRGYTYEDVANTWKPYDVCMDGSDLLDKKLLVMDSVDDPVIPYEDAKMHVDAWQEQGVDVELITVRRLNHVRTIGRNFFRLLTVSKFFG